MCGVRTRFILPPCFFIISSSTIPCKHMLISIACKPLNKSFIIAQKPRCSNVMFSVVSIRQSFCPQGEGSPCDHYPWYIGPHCTEVHLPEMGPHCTGPRSPATDIWCGNHHWRPVQTCSLHWHMVKAIEAHIVGASGRYASYRNAFLFKLCDGNSFMKPVFFLISVHDSIYKYLTSSDCAR